MTETQGLTTPPHSIEAEEATLGSILIDPECFADVGHLDSKDFYIVKHQWVFEAARELVKRNEPIDMLTIQEELAKKDRLNELGGPAFITRLITLTASSFNVKAYGDIVKEAATRRNLIYRASEIVRLAYDVSTDVITVINESAAGLDALTPQTGQNFDAMDTALSWQAEVSDRLNGVSRNAISTGYKSIDEKTTGGGKRGEVVVMAALPSMGKTSLFTQMAARQSSPALGYKVGIFSEEMRKEDLLEIMVLSRMNRSAESLTLADMPTVDRLCTEIGQQSFMVNDVSGMTVAEIGRQAREMKREMGGLDVIYIDHLGYIQHVGGKGENKAALIGNTMKGLARLAKQLNILVVVLCQLARNDKYSADNPPELTDLRESGDIEADARQVWIVHRKDYFADLENALPKNEAQTANVIIRKNHKGPRNVTAYLQYIDESRQFSETYNYMPNPGPVPMPYLERDTEERVYEYP